MLCIALFAFVLIEDASALDDPCHTGSAAVPYNIAGEVASPSDASDDPSAPQDQSPQTALHQHHCCGAHATGLPTGDGIAAPSPLPSNQLIAYADQFAPAGDPGGLERPPKPSALA
ncbi:MAG: hypothetical protein BroJett013_26250 [Alphaproteobacteria bacterium]|mgnify:FL=1|nr:MAG: hypothetical protein BroJett013_26250 [Alphaproteobacteria bacterium]